MRNIFGIGRGRYLVDSSRIKFLDILKIAKF